MDSKEIHAWMKKGLPVVCDGKKYVRILEYVSWFDSNGKHQLSCVLLDGRNSVRVKAEKVEKWENTTK